MTPRPIVASAWDGIWLVLAFAATALLFLRLGWSGRVRRAVRELLDALRGVLPPLAVVLVVGAFTTPLPLVQVLVGAAIGTILAHWVYSREWSASFEHRRRFEGYGVIGVVAGLVVLVVVAVMLRALPDYDDKGGIPSALAITAALGFGAALIARLVGYAWQSSAWRVVTVTLVFLLILRTLLAFGVIGVKLPIGDKPSLTLTLAIVAVGIAASLAAEAAFPRVTTAADTGEPSKEGEPSHPTALGLGLAVSSMLFISVALIWGGIEIGTSAERSTRGLTNAEDVQMRFSEWSDDALALAFLPVLRFDDRARWTPELVESYVARAQLTEPGQPARPATLSDLTTPCGEGLADPCRTLTLVCPRADNDDGTPCSLDRTADAPADPGIYVRVARKGRLLPGEPNPFEAFGPRAMIDDLTTLVQYWFFYDYDEWVAPVLGGRLVQRHEGDWEAVSIGLADTRPLFVGFSEHCGGVWQKWSRPVSLTDTSTAAFATDVAVTADQRFTRATETSGPQSWDEARRLPTHAVVQVAVGSQANYPPRLSNRAPDWSTCQGIPRQAVALLSYISNIRDRTGSDFTYIPRTLRLVDRRTPPMTFPGTWGRKDSMQFVTTVDDPDAPGGRGPATPTRQPLWQRPVFQIFCSIGWRGDGQARDASCKAQPSTGA
jgi:hypothetical protein